MVPEVGLTVSQLPLEKVETVKLAAVLLLEITTRFSVPVVPPVETLNVSCVGDALIAADWAGRRLTRPNSRKKDAAMVELVSFFKYKCPPKLCELYRGKAVQHAAARGAETVGHVAAVEVSIHGVIWL